MRKNLQPLSNRMEAARGSSLAQVKTAQLAREEEEKIRSRRVRGAIVLVEQFLADQGYVQSLSALQQESGVSMQVFTAADNIDLLTVVAEFEQFYEHKFQRRPKLFRQRDGSDGSGGVTAVGAGSGEKMLTRKPRGAGGGAAASPTTAQLIQQGNHLYAGSAPPSTTSSPVPPADNGRAGSSGQQQQQQQQAPPKHLRPIGGLAHHNHPSDGPGAKETKDAGPGLNLLGQKLTVHAAAADDDGSGGGGGRDAEDNDPYTFYSGRALKPLPVFPTHELNDLAATIMRDILDVSPSVRWGDIAELDDAKHLLKEAVVMPVKYPELFEGIMRPWKGILLFGPPGTGKTLLAKAVATECRTTFFNISASSVVSKWRGDSEKLVRMLFDLAVHYAPSTIFIDEIDSLMSARSSDGEHEGSRRMKTELLSQMDGLSKRRGGEVVFVLAASNTPWDLDTAMLRRLEKRVLVSLPTATARAAMFRKLLLQQQQRRGAADAASASAEVLDYGACAAMTEGMSGADIDIVCREAIMRPIRKMIAALEQQQHPQRRESLEAVRVEGRPRVTLEDVEASVACTRSSVSPQDLKRYADWMAKFGSSLSV